MLLIHWRLLLTHFFFFLKKTSCFSSSLILRTVFSKCFPWRSQISHRRDVHCALNCGRPSQALSRRSRLPAARRDVKSHVMSCRVKEGLLRRVFHGDKLHCCFILCFFFSLSLLWCFLVWIGAISCPRFLVSHFIHCFELFRNQFEPLVMIFYILQSGPGAYGRGASFLP